MRNEAGMSIADAVHETASDLFEHGFINKKAMTEFNILCGKNPPDYDASRVKTLRERFNLSQSVLAAFMNMSPSTIRQWEQGVKTPSGAAKKLLFLLETKGVDVLL
jgi:putative transcriptional regulator